VEFQLKLWGTGPPFWSKRAANDRIQSISVVYHTFQDTLRALKSVAQARWTSSGARSAARWCLAVVTPTEVFALATPQSTINWCREILIKYLICTWFTFLVPVWHSRGRGVDSNHTARAARKPLHWRKTNTQPLDVAEQFRKLPTEMFALATPSGKKNTGALHKKFHEFLKALEASCKEALCHQMQRPGQQLISLAQYYLATKHRAELQLQALRRSGFLTAAALQLLGRLMMATVHRSFGHLLPCTPAEVVGDALAGPPPAPRSPTALPAPLYRPQTRH
jgi:hypothetical protein